jgi:rhamnosyltransferase
MIQVSVIIPTLQAEKQLPRLIDNLRQQTIPPSEVIIVDSSSTDNTIAIAQDADCVIKSINRRDFRHGSSRNLGARQARGDILLFMTQDALPVNQLFIEKLIQPLCEGIASASTARQIAFPQANPIEKFSRHFNYSDKNTIRSADDINKLGIKAYFFSNTASAIFRGAFWSLGGFSENVIVNEDMYLCAMLINRGYCVAYQAEALIYHSHNYSLTQLFGRYFDIGVFFTQASDELRNVRSESEGFRFVRYGLKYLADQQAWSWMARLLVESIIKYIAFRMGMHNHIIPINIKRKISGQNYLW